MSPLVEPAWLAARLEDPALVLLDAHVAWGTDGPDPVQSAVELAQGHIPGARHADLVTRLSDGGAPFQFANPDPALLAERLAALGVGPGRKIVIYDRTLNMWAARLWWMLRAIGIEAAVLDGGWDAWRAAGLAVAVGKPAPPVATAPWHPQLRPLFAGLEAVAAIVAGRAPQTPLVCALPEDVFTGATAIYGRHGHIPGSISLPAATLLTPDGRFLPPAVLADRLAPIVAGRAPLLYCGSGVSAAVIALALAVIGCDAGVRIYDGSLEEWGSDPARPLALGPGSQG